MAFVDRVVDYPGRYILKDANSGTVFGTYDLVRDEGTIHEPGTLLNANNLNNPDITTLSIGGTQVKDYIVELGSSGGWTWRKWANGSDSSFISGFDRHNDATRLFGNLL